MVMPCMWKLNSCSAILLCHGATRQFHSDSTMCKVPDMYELRKKNSRNKL